MGVGMSQQLSKHNYGQCAGCHAFHSGQISGTHSLLVLSWSQLVSGSFALQLPLNLHHVPPTSVETCPCPRWACVASESSLTSLGIMSVAKWGDLAEEFSLRPTSKPFIN